MSILRRAISLVVFLGILLISFNLPYSYALSNDSGNKCTDSATCMESWDYHVKLKNESKFRDLKWRAVGPVFQGGRIESVACPANEPYTIYVGVGAGNLWKTINNGLTWEAIFENESTFSIGCVAVSKSNSDFVWVGTGEAHLSGTSFAGTGVFKSTDAGKTWKNMGLYDSHHIGKVVIDPFDADIVFVAAIGHMSSRNKERGILKTTDGGKNWKKVLYINDGVRFMDLVMDPADHKTLYAASWDARGGLDSGVFKTTDGGDIWKRLTNGINQGKHIGRIALDVSISNSNVVYALLVNKEPRSGKKRSRFGSIGGEVYRSDDKGTTWRKVNEKYLETYVENMERPAP